MEDIMKVKDAMHSGVTWVDPKTPVSELAKRMRDEDIGAIPVGENDKLIGMVTDRDICCRGVADGHDPSKLTARDVMSKGIFYCRTGDDLNSALDAMSKKHIRRLTVIDDNKRMVGMLSLGDASEKADARKCATTLKAVSAHHH